MNSEDEARAALVDVIAAARMSTITTRFDEDIAAAVIRHLASRVSTPPSEHDDQCEAEWIDAAPGWTECGCSTRRATREAINPCGCSCHTTRSVMHVAPCCDLPVLLTDKERDDV